MRRLRKKAAPAEKTRAVAYIRVSTEKQADNGISLEAQRAKLLGYADLFEIDVVEVVVDAGVSAKTLDRPGLCRARELVASGAANAILVAKLDRLTRSVRDLGELLEDHFTDGAPHPASLVCLHEKVDTRSAGGRLVLNLLMSVAQWERETISERTSAAMQHLRAQGAYTGGKARFGFRVGQDGHLERHEGEQATIARAQELRGQGQSLRAVARTLASEGHVSRSGRAFDAGRLLRLLRDAEDASEAEAAA